MSVIDVVVGAAFGSEGKGHITAQLVQKRLDLGLDVLNIRVAGPNAGHTVLDSNMVPFPLRCIPVGAAIDDEVYLHIAAGSEVEPDVLFAELALLRSEGHNVSRLTVSGEATLLEEKHKTFEGERDLTGKLGSTGKGIGAARAERIYREAKRVKDDIDFVTKLNEHGVGVTDINPGDQERFNAAWTTNTKGAIIIEGTQGYGLGLHAGFYPQCTSSDARAIDFLAMAGLSPWARGVERLDIWLVARVFPIRVAGNSGPLAGETDWQTLGLPEERTTVTKKVRRVGAWDGKLIHDAVLANGGGQPNVHIALTMIDQLFPWLSGVNNLYAVKLEGVDAAEGKKFAEFLKKVESDAGAKIGVISTSPNTVVWSA